MEVTEGSYREGEEKLKGGRRDGVGDNFFKKSPANPENPLHKCMRKRIVLLVFYQISIKPDCEMHYRRYTEIAKTKSNTTFYIVEQLQSITNMFSILMVICPLVRAFGNMFAVHFFSQFTW